MSRLELIKIDKAKTCARFAPACATHKRGLNPNLSQKGGTICHLASCTEIYTKIGYGGSSKGLIPNVS